MLTKEIRDEQWLRSWSIYTYTGAWMKRKTGRPGRVGKDSFVCPFPNYLKSMGPKSTPASRKDKKRRRIADPRLYLSLNKFSFSFSGTNKSWLNWLLTSFISHVSSNPKSSGNHLEHKVVLLLACYHLTQGSCWTIARLRSNIGASFHFFIFFGWKHFYSSLFFYFLYLNLLY